MTDSYLLYLALPSTLILSSFLVVMPGMSGYEMCKKFRLMEGASCVPVIMVSAKVSHSSDRLPLFPSLSLSLSFPLSLSHAQFSPQGDEAHIVEGLECGSNDYVVKPFSRKEILARVAAHLVFRDAVFAAGESSGAAGDHSGSLLPFFPAILAEHLHAVQGRFSLPPSIKFQVGSFTLLSFSSRLISHFPLPFLSDGVLRSSDGSSDV